MTDKEVTTYHRLAQRRVNRGVKWLDKTIPDWLERLYPHVLIEDENDIDGFNLSHAGNCVLGWAYGNYWTAIRTLVGEDSNEHFGVIHGFMPLGPYTYEQILRSRWIETTKRLGAERGIAA